MDSSKDPPDLDTVIAAARFVLATMPRKRDSVDLAFSMPLYHANLIFFYFSHPLADQVASQAANKCKRAAHFCALTVDGWVILYRATEDKWENVEYGPIGLRILLQRLRVLLPELPVPQRAAVSQFLQLATQFL